MRNGTPKRELTGQELEEDVSHAILEARPGGCSSLRTSRTDASVSDYIASGGDAKHWRRDEFST